MTDGVEEGTTVTATYSGTKKVKSVTATTDAEPTLNAVDISTLTANYVAQSGDVLSGTLSTNVKISIADGATVTLDGVTINGNNDENYYWAGINCLGDTTIVLKDGTTNTVKGFYDEYLGIHVPTGKKLTIKGSTAGNGKLTASSNGYGAGIASQLKASIDDAMLVMADKDATQETVDAMIDSLMQSVDEAVEDVKEAQETGIDLAPAAAAEGDGVWYDLQGRPVEKPTKGTYIYNGKKYSF